MLCYAASVLDDIISSIEYLVQEAIYFVEEEKSRWVGILEMRGSTVTVAKSFGSGQNPVWTCIKGLMVSLWSPPL